MSPIQENDFPYASICSLCVGVVANCIVFTAPLPYIAFMMVDFGVARDLDRAGYSAGWIAGIFMIGRLISGIPFGVLADRWGRKPCLMISLFNMAAFGLLFGLSTNYTTALVTRSLCGIGNGYMGVVPTVVTELTKNKDHETKAFGYVNSAYGIGFIIGPVIGGLLARPASQYPKIISSDSLWGWFPYLLPSLACALFAITGLVLVWYLVPETLKRSGEASISIEMTHTHEEKQYGSIATTDDEETCASTAVNSTDSSTKSLDQQPFTVPSTPRTPATTDLEGTDLTFHELLTDSHLAVIILVSFLFSCFAVMVKEVFPLWCVSSTANGGLHWSSPQVGLILCSVGVALVVFQIFLYQPLMSRLFEGVCPSLILHHQIVGAAVPIMLLPFAQWMAITVLTSFGEPAAVVSSSIVLYVVVIVIYALHNILIVTCYSSLAMIINASVSPGRRCTLNGFTATASSLGNFAAPVIGANLFALLDTVRNVDNDDNLLRFVDGRLVFVLAGVLLLWLARVVKTRLPTDAEVS